MKRRAFFRQVASSASGLAVLGSAQLLRASSPARKIRVAIIGCNGRGMDHIAGYSNVPDVEIAYVCDVDSRATQKGLAAVAKKQEAAAKGLGDFRQALEDRTIDAVSIATPDHWHAPAAILACVAGKHVYVEKPGSHNPHESQLLVAASRKHKRVVQMGNQRRSWPWVIEVIESLRGGEIGKLFFARAWYTNHRGSIGHGKPAAVPEWLNYALWQGPAPEYPFKDNILHYNWHWFWHWGTGELGNNGVHALDLARWGLEVNLPRRVTCAGNRYHFQDDQETPDVISASFDYGDKAIFWEGQSCDPRGFEGASFGVEFFGEKGSMAIAGNNCRVFDLNNKLLREVQGKSDDTIHFNNFVSAIRDGAKLNSEIEDGQRSTMLCHLGNIAWRTGHTLNTDPQSGAIKDDHAATALWRRKYRPGWEPKV